MTVEQDKELTQKFTEWMAPGITHGAYDAHVIEWLRAPGAPVFKYLRQQAEHAKLARTPDELAFDSAWDAWEKVDELTAERNKVELWTDASKQSKDERNTELKRIDSAIAELIDAKAPAQNAATPVTEAIPVVDTKKSTPKWLEVSGVYIANVLSEGRCASAKELFTLLESKTVIEGSPFERGTGVGRGCLYVTDLNKNVSLKTFQNLWTEIKNIAK